MAIRELLLDGPCEIAGDGQVDRYTRLGMSEVGEERIAWRVVFDDGREVPAHVANVVFTRIDGVLVEMWHIERHEAPDVDDTHQLMTDAIVRITDHLIDEDVADGSR